jgi:hypothetical protein
MRPSFQNISQGAAGRAYPEVSPIGPAGKPHSLSPWELDRRCDNPAPPLWWDEDVDGERRQISKPRRTAAAGAR